MGKRLLTKRSPRKKIVAPKPTEIIDGIENVEIGTMVRFRLDAENWSQGKVHGENKDGSLIIIESSSGNLRSIRVPNVERVERGPRGGKRWVPIQTENSSQRK